MTVLALVRHLCHPANSEIVWQDWTSFRVCILNHEIAFRTRFSWRLNYLKRVIHGQTERKQFPDASVMLSTPPFDDGTRIIRYLDANLFDLDEWKSILCRWTRTLTVKWHNMTQRRKIIKGTMRIMICSDVNSIMPCAYITTYFQEN